MLGLLKFAPANCYLMMLSVKLNLGIYLKILARRAFLTYVDLKLGVFHFAIITTIDLAVFF